MMLFDLPHELLAHVARFLDVVSLCRLAQTCMAARWVAHDEGLFGRIAHRECEQVGRAPDETARTFVQRLWFRNGPRFVGALGRGLSLCVQEKGGVAVWPLVGDASLEPLSFRVAELSSGIVGFGIVHASMSSVMMGDHLSGALYSNGAIGMRGALHADPELPTFGAGDTVRVLYNARDGTLGFQVNSGAVVVPYFQVPPRHYRFAVCTLEVVGLKVIIKSD